MTMRRVLTLGATGILMAGGAGWSLTPTPTHALAALRPCSANGVHITVSWKTGGAGLPGGGGIEGAIRVTKKGTGVCALRGWPHMRIFDSRLHRLPVSSRKKPVVGNGLPTVVLNGSATPRPVAVATVNWLDWCKGTISKPISVAVRLPKRKHFKHVHLKSGADLQASCVNPTVGSVVDVGPFTTP